MEKQVSAWWCYMRYCAQEVDSITVIVMLRWVDRENKFCTLIQKMMQRPLQK